MLYYKIVNQFRMVDKDSEWYEFIENSLITKKELEKIIELTPQNYVKFIRNAVLIEHSKRKIHFCFGVRFANK